MNQDVGIALYFQPYTNLQVFESHFSARVGMEQPGHITVTHVSSVSMSWILPGCARISGGNGRISPVQLSFTSFRTLVSYEPRL